MDDATDDDRMREAHIGLFTGTWRVVREQLRLQADTLRILYSQAGEANEARPMPPPLRLEMAEDDWAAFSDFFERNGRATGARDVYASAVVLFIDLALKELLRFYERIPNVPRLYGVSVNGVNVFDAFRAAGNNVRHHDEWRAPTRQIPMADQAYWAVTIIATVVGRAVPERDALSVMAANWAWPVLHAVGCGTFEGWTCPGFVDTKISLS